MSDKPDTSRPWVSRDPFGGWVYWHDEDHYREHHLENALYRDGRPANECECSFIQKMMTADADEIGRFANVLLAAIDRNTPPERLS